MQQQLKTVMLIVTTCMIIYNQVLRNTDRAAWPPRESKPDYGTGAWRTGVSMQDSHVIHGGNTASTEGKKQRNLFKHWASSDAGSVLWQESNLNQIIILILLQDMWDIYIIWLSCVYQEGIQYNFLIRSHS